MHELTVNIVNEVDVLTHDYILCIFSLFFFQFENDAEFKKKNFSIKKRIKLRGLNE